MERNFFIENVIAIVPPSGEVIKVKRKPEEQFHYEIFNRIDNEIISNYLDNFVLIPEAYNGHDYATISASNGNAIFIPVNIDRCDVMIVAVPNIVTEEQKKSIEDLLKELDMSVLYLLECKKKNQTLSDPSAKDIKTYIYDANTKKTLDDLNDLIIEEENSIGGRK